MILSALIFRRLTENEVQKAEKQLKEKPKEMEKRFIPEEGVGSQRVFFGAFPDFVPSYFDRRYGRERRQGIKK
jgi:hypothetical protein